jgi:predicted enzyme related to lactoylglutathione lyase
VFYINQGVKTIIYQVNDMARAKMQFRTLLGVDPYGNQPYYIGFKVGDQDIGLVPNSPEAGMTAFYHVDDIKQRLQSLLDIGSRILREIKDVGGGRLVESKGDYYERKQ